MSISMERFAAEGHFAVYTPGPKLSRSVGVFQLQCRSCGYEPDSLNVVAPRLCPKCHSQSWERFARSGSILANATRQ
jgi:Zn finger protein HypA/HybF involved in hydrogenase expression